MKRFILSFLLITMLLAAADANAQQRNGWSVSSSASEPCNNSGTIPPGLVSLYLWYAYNSPDGLSAADISVVTSPLGALLVLASIPANGFLNAGTQMDLLLAVGGCPDAPINAGSWLIQANASSWELCLGGNNLSVDCQLNPAAWPNDYLGFVNQGNPSTVCCGGFVEQACGGCGTVSVDNESWGGIKAMYR